jgi:hypothetical protein
MRSILYRYGLKLATLTITAVLFSGCGGDDKEKWGIDQSSIPKCSGGINDSSAAILVPSGAEVKSVKPDTTVRVWHYSNSDKLVCVIAGEAILKEGS